MDDAEARAAYRREHPDTLAYAPWPTYDPALLADDDVEIVVQVNGKVRGRVSVARDDPSEVIEATALRDSNIAKHLDGMTVDMLVYIPNKLINFVVRETTKPR